MTPPCGLSRSAIRRHEIHKASVKTRRNEIVGSVRALGGLRVCVRIQQIVLPAMAKTTGGIGLAAPAICPGERKE
jgi:hypothetical protein